MSAPNHGHIALIELAKDLVDNPNSIPRKDPQKNTVLHRDPVSHSDMMGPHHMGCGSGEAGGLA